MKPPELILNYAKGIIEDGHSFFSMEKILNERRRNAIAAIRDYKECKQRFLRDKEVRETIGAWLDAVQVSD